jgi:hypothetical protein
MESTETLAGCEACRGLNWIRHPAGSCICCITMAACGWAFDCGVREAEIARLSYLRDRERVNANFWERRCILLEEEN